ncbi:hypothetical protein ACFQH9_02120 [Pseudonocardia lutea]|uniref:Head-tail joining protein n=1 Tax=Pseudonocardia lutea TaxID=2172015 RepID=A0ABW1I2P3_9PSEU
MYALANTTVSVLRGSTVDEFGDETDNETVAASGIIANIRETSSTFSDPGSTTPRVVRNVTCKLPSTTDVTETDRIKDETSGVIYTINTVTQEGGPGRTPDLALLLERTT